MRQYKVGSNAVLVHTENCFVEGWEPCGSVEELQTKASGEVDKDLVGLKWVGTKIPAAELEKVLGTIRCFPHRETLYRLEFNLADRTWRITCPVQKGSGALVEGDAETVENGYLTVGAIHTHPEMGAFWSGTDVECNSKHGGLYVVFGTKGGVPSTWKCSVFSPSGVYDQDLWSVFDQVDFGAEHAPVEEWVKRINEAAFQQKEAAKSCSVEALKLGYDEPYWSRKASSVLVPACTPRRDRDREDSSKLQSMAEETLLAVLSGLLGENGTEDTRVATADWAFDRYGLLLAGMYDTKDEIDVAAVGMLLSVQQGSLGPDFDRLLYDLQKGLEKMPLPETGVEESTVLAPTDAEMTESARIYQILDSASEEMTSEQVARVMRELLYKVDIWPYGYEGTLVDSRNKTEVMDYIEGLTEYIEDNAGYCVIDDNSSYEYLLDELRRFV